MPLPKGIKKKKTVAMKNAQWYLTKFELALAENRRFS